MTEKVATHRFSLKHRFSALGRIRIMLGYLLQALEKYCGFRATALLVRIGLATGIIVLLDLLLQHVLNRPLHVVLLKSLVLITQMPSGWIKSALILFWSVIAVIVVTAAGLLVVGFITSRWPSSATPPEDPSPDHDCNASS